jgi:hypothetical protein
MDMNRYSDRDRIPGVAKGQYLPWRSGMAMVGQPILIE